MNQILTNNLLLTGAGGTLLSLITLFFFVSKYTAADAPEEEDFDCDMDDADSSSSDDAEPSAPKPEITTRKAFPSASAANADEVSELKEKIKELYYKLEEMQLVHETKNTDCAATLTKLEARLTTFENEYVNKLQPTLSQLIEELENLKPTEQQ